MLPLATLVLGCLIVGDGIADSIVKYFPECRSSTGLQIVSTEILAKLETAVAGGRPQVTIISVGSHDPGNHRLRSNLFYMRAAAGAKVIWILPIDPVARSAVNKSAAVFGDVAVGFVPAGDNIHPRRSQDLAEIVRDKMYGRD